MGCAKFPQASKGLLSQIPTTCKSLGQTCGLDERCCPLTVCRFLGSEKGYFCAADLTTASFDEEGILVTTGITVMTIIFILFFTCFIIWCTKKRREMNELLQSSESGANNNNENGPATDETISRPMERALGRMMMRQTNNSTTSNQEPRRQTTRSDGPRRDPPPSYTDVLNDSPELPSYNEALANEYGTD